MKMFGMILVASSMIVSINAFADLADLGIDKTKPLKELVSDVNTALSDGNITTGTTHTGLLQLSEAVRNPKALNEALFKKKFKSSVEAPLPEDAKITTVVSKFPKNYYQIAYDLAEGNAATMDKCPRTSVDSLAKTELCENLHDYAQMIMVIAKKMTENGGELLAVRSSTKVRNEDDQELRSVTFSSLYNVKTKQLVWVFTIEGTM